MTDKEKDLMGKNEIKKSFLLIICFCLTMQRRKNKSHPTNHHSSRF
jgi:hypothetical protein